LILIAFGPTVAYGNLGWLFYPGDKVLAGLVCDWCSPLPYGFSPPLFW